MSLIHDQHSQSSGGMYLIFDNNWNIYVNETAQYNLDNGSVSHKSVLTKYSNSGAEQWSVEQKAHEIFQDIPNNLHFWSHPVFDKNNESANDVDRFFNRVFEPIAVKRVP